MRLQPAPLRTGLRHRHTLELLFAVSRRMRRIGPRERGTSEWISRGKWQPPLYICMLCTLPLGRHEKEMIFWRYFKRESTHNQQRGGFCLLVYQQVKQYFDCKCIGGGPDAGAGLDLNRSISGDAASSSASPIVTSGFCKTTCVNFYIYVTGMKKFFCLLIFFMSISVLILNGKKSSVKKRKILNFLFCSCSTGKEKVSPENLHPKIRKIWSSWIIDFFDWQNPFLKNGFLVRFVNDLFLKRIRARFSPWRL